MRKVGGGSWLRILGDPTFNSNLARFILLKENESKNNNKGNVSTL